MTAQSKGSLEIVSFFNVLPSGGRKRDEGVYKVSRSYLGQIWSICNEKHRRNRYSISRMDRLKIGRRWPEDEREKGEG